MTTRLLIVGPQGSGKGTQGVRVAEAYGIPVVSTGDIFRANIKGGTELGLKVKAITDAGNLVPDDVTGEIVSDRLSQSDAVEAGFLLDGYPRNAAQVAYLDDFLASRGAALDAVILLEVPRAESVARITERADDRGALRRHGGGHRSPPRHLRDRDGADRRDVRPPRRARPHRRRRIPRPDHRAHLRGARRARHRPVDVPPLDL